MDFDQFDDMLDTGVPPLEPDHVESRVVRAVRPASEPTGFEGAGDLVDGVVRAAARCGVTVDTKKLDMRPHLCALCIDAKARVDPNFNVQDCERILVSGRVYWAWACKFHIDIDWSKRWQERLAKAKDGAERDRLQAEKTRRVQAGRSVF